MAIASASFRPSAASGPPSTDIDALLVRVFAGEEVAWHKLVAIVHGRATRQCARRDHGDAGPDVAARVVERLRRDDFAALRSYVRQAERYEESDFFAWLRLVVRRVQVDWLRGQPEALRRQQAGQRQLQAVARVPLSGSERAQDLGVDARAELLRVAEVLAGPDFSAQARRAIGLWLAGFDNREIASRLGLASEIDARRLLHATRQRLRRTFRDPAKELT